jgi:hypothetical protein
MIAVIVGSFLLLAAIVAPRFGINLHRGRPGMRGRIDNSLPSRLAAAIIGLLSIWFGLSRFYP